MFKQYFYFSMEIWGAMYVLMAALWVFLSQHVNKEQKVAMLHVLLIDALLLISDGMAWLLRGSAGFAMRTWLIIFNFFSFFWLYMMIYMMWRYVRSRMILTRVKEQDRKRKAVRRKIEIILRRSMEVLISLGCLGLIINLFTGQMYSFTEDNLYVRGPLFVIFRAPSVIGFIVLVLAVIASFDLYENQFRMALGICIIPSVLSVFVEMFIYGFSLMNVSVTLSIQILLIEFLLHVTAMHRKNQEELDNMKIKLMMSQIRPHFIYNVLSTIYVLCRKDVEKAREGISYFTKYLRGNLDTIGADDLVPFEQELDNVKNYLYLEKMRFGDQLNVAYDLQVMDFMIPSLAVQVLVENAVKYGVRGSYKDGTVWISTRKEADNMIVEIRDDGPGYHPEKNAGDGRSHIGLCNTRKRVEAMCQGTLEVRCGEDGTGTIAQIRIPEMVTGTLS